MYFFAVVAFAVLPFFAEAVPFSLKSSRTGHPISIPLTKRSKLWNGQGSIDLDKRRFDQVLGAYERGESYPTALTRGHSNERRIYIPDPLTSHSNVAWTGDIAVGNPARAYSVVIDTTTPDMSLDGISCPTCHGKNLYDISASSTGKNLSSTAVWAVFSSGAVTGSVIIDDVSVAGYHVSNQRIIVATSKDGSHGGFPDFQGDGIMGLGFKQTSTFGSGVDSFFTTLVASVGPAFGEVVFGLVLAGSGPALIVGGRDASKFSGEFTFFDLTSKGSWQIPLDSILINGNVAVATKNAILDTGNVFISSNVQTIIDIHRDIPGSAPTSDNGVWALPCDTSVTITINFNGTAFDIPPSAYVLTPIANADNRCISAFAEANTPNVYIGTSFLQNVYTEFDQGNRKVGFALI